MAEPAAIDNAKLPVEATASEASLSARLLAAQYDERRRISRELHDSIGQTLASAKIILERLGRKQVVADSAEYKELEQILGDAVTEVRTISHLLHPPTLDLIGL